MSSPTSDLLLRSLPAGSLAAVILIPQGPAATPALARCVHCILPENDGAMDGRVIFARDAIGVRGVIQDSGTTVPQTIVEPSGVVDVSQLPSMLKRSTGLPIDMLAAIVGVTKVTYHKWLRGGGIAEESHERLQELAELLPTLLSFRADLRDFLKTPLAIGSPVELLAQRQDATVVGLALRHGVVAPLELATSGAGLRQVRPLGTRPAINREALERFAPRAITEVEAEPLEDESDIDPTAIGFALFV